MICVKTKNLHDSKLEEREIVSIYGQIFLIFRKINILDINRPPAFPVIFLIYFFCHLYALFQVTLSVV